MYHNLNGFSGGRSAGEWGLSLNSFILFNDLLHGAPTMTIPSDQFNVKMKRNRNSLLAVRSACCWKLIWCVNTHDDGKREQTKQKKKPKERKNIVEAEWTWSTN